MTTARPRMVHDLKIETPHIEAIISGQKTFEIREFDRPYVSGDTVVLHENGGEARVVRATIGHISDYAQQQCYIVFSLLDVRQDVNRIYEYA